MNLISRSPLMMLLPWAVWFGLVLPAQAQTADVDFHAQHALVVDDNTGEVLLSKNSSESVPMASLTKLLTLMVVLDADQDLGELLTVTQADMDTLKHTHSGVPVGATLTRGKMMELALMASDNHAASSLARHYPGGMPAFLNAVQDKLAVLRLSGTQVVEPTGLSPQNRSTAADLAVVAREAAAYPVIVAATTQSRGEATVNGRPWQAQNTNRLVGKPGWDILLSKTGFTNEAGRCLVMRMRAAGRTVLVVLLNASAGAQRTLDATNINRWLEGLTPLTMRSAEAPAGVAKRRKQGKREPLARQA